jgi:hypothetical protein
MEEGFEGGIPIGGVIGIGAGLIAITVFAVKLANWQPPNNNLEQPLLQPTAGGKRRTRRSRPRRGTRRV